MYKYLRITCPGKSILSQSEVTFTILAYQLPSVSNDNRDIHIYEIIKSTVSVAELGLGFGFRLWNYTYVAIILSPSSIQTDVYLDTGYGISLIDRAYLFGQLPDIQISKMASPLKVRSIGLNRHLTDKYVFIPVYIPGTKDGVSILVCFKREFHIVNELRANILIGNNTIGPESIDIRILDRLAYIGSCNIICQIEYRRRGQFKRRKIYAE